MSQFLIKTNPNIQDVVQMPTSEAHHLRDVFRIRLGDIVRLFNGEGVGYRACVETLEKNRVMLKILEKWQHQVPRVAIDCAVALLPRDAMVQVIQRVTECGVRKLIPFKTDRSIVKNKPNLDQWEKTALAACKQCERLTLPELREPVSMQTLIDTFSGYDMVLFAHQDGNWIRQELEEGRAEDNVQSVLTVVGPEGGFTDAEIEKIVCAGARKVSLGPHIFRSEAAVGFMSAALNYRYGESE